MHAKCMGEEVKYAAQNHENNFVLLIVLSLMGVVPVLLSTSRSML